MTTASSAASAGACRGLGIEHSPVIDATIGWIVVLNDPDGIELHLHSRQRHGIDQVGPSGYGRPVPGTT